MHQRVRVLSGWQVLGWAGEGCCWRGARAVVRVRTVEGCIDTGAAAACWEACCARPCVPLQTCWRSCCWWRCLCVCGGHRRSVPLWSPPQVACVLWRPLQVHPVCGWAQQPAAGASAGRALCAHCRCCTHSCAAAAGHTAAAANSCAANTAVLLPQVVCGPWVVWAGATLSSHSARCHRYRFSAGCGEQATACCRTALCFNTYVLLSCSCTC